MRPRMTTTTPAGRGTLPRPLSPEEGPMSTTTRRTTGPEHVGTYIVEGIGFGDSRDFAVKVTRPDSTTAEVSVWWPRGEDAEWVAMAAVDLALGVSARQATVQDDPSRLGAYIVTVEA